MKKFFLAALLLLGSTFASATTVYERDGVVQDTGGHAVANAKIRVCSGGTANTTTACSSFVNVYRDYGLTQLVDQVNNPIVSNAGGAYQFFTSTSPVDIQFQARGVFSVTSNVAFTAAGAGGIGGSGTIGYFPVFTGDTTTLGNSPLDNGISNSGKVTSSLPLIFPTAAWNTNSTVGATTKYVDRALPVYTPHELGLTCAGADEGSALQTALTALGTAGGGIVQLQPGDTCNAGSTAITWPVQVWMRGTGREGSALWGTYPSASSYLQVGCNDSHGCIKMITTGSGGMSDLAIRNTTTCSAFIFQTKMVVDLDRVSFQGSQGSRATNNACNDVIVAGLNQNTCATDENCYFIGYNSHYNIYTDKIRRAMAGETLQTTEGVIHSSSTNSNSTVHTDGTGLGPFFDCIGYSGGGINCIQNRFVIFGELGNSGSSVNPGDAHYNTIFRGDYAGDNVIEVMADDSAQAPYASTAAFVLTANAGPNFLNCFYYQTSRIPCFSDANSGSHQSIYTDVPGSAFYIRNLFPVHIGSASLPATDGFFFGSGGNYFQLLGGTLAGNRVYTVPDQGGNATWCLSSSYISLTDGATVAWDAKSSACINAALLFTTHGGSRTLNLSNLVTGGHYRLKLTQDGTGGEGLTLGTGCTWKVTGGGGGAVSLTAGAGAIDILEFTYDGTNCLLTGIFKNLT